MNLHSIWRAGFGLVGRALRARRVLIVALVVLSHTAHAANDLDLAKTDSPDPARVGQELTFHIAVTNLGPAQATNVVVTDVLPPSYSLVSCAVSQGTYTNESGTVRAWLGALANGATAGVTIVVTPGEAGWVTNWASLTWDDESESERASAVTEVRSANRPPEIQLPGPHVLPVGSTTSFVVRAIDHDDYDTVTITNTVKPAGATYVNSNFTWTAGVSFENTTNVLTFVANDGQGEPNSIVTNSTVIIVPYDWDEDGLRDGWEWTHFQSLTNLPGGDNDGDGADNYSEYVAGTQPTNANSAFKVKNVLGTGTSTQHWVEVWTEPELKYTIEFKDDLQAGWNTFANPANGIGTWLETNTTSTTYRFLDDEGAQTTGGAQPDKHRYYRVKVERL